MKFNVVLVGVGGQGVLTLGKIIGKAALLEGYEVFVSEIHGLAQRGGSLLVQVRFGDKITSPLISPGEADLMIALEAIEALRYAYYLTEEPTIVMNKTVIPPPLTEFKLNFEDIVKLIRQHVKNPRIYTVNATDIVLKIGLPQAVNTVVLGATVGAGVLPLKMENVTKALEYVLKKKALEKNLEAFELGKKSLTMLPQ